MVNFIIKGRPMTKKNHCQIIRNRNTGRPMIIQSPQYQQYEKEFFKQMDENLKGLFDTEVHLHMRVLYYFSDRRGKPDLVNLIQATQDILQKFGLYGNDSQIKSLDGSRIVGIDRDNPRAEIEIKNIKEDD